MQLGQILNILKEQYLSPSDRREIIHIIWNNMIVPQVSKYQHILKSQKVGLYHLLGFRNDYELQETVAEKVGVSQSLIAQFDSMIKQLSNELHQIYIEQIASGNLQIRALYDIKDEYTRLSKQLQKPYEDSLEKLMSQLREAVVDSAMLAELKNIKGIAPYLTEDNAKSMPTDSLKITDLHVMRMGSEGTNNWMFVKIETDAGICGWGEASLQYKDDALLGEFVAFKRFLLGKNPFEIERIWTSLYRRVTWSGGPVTTSAISAIDLALWDIKGKALGVPVYELLGGKSHDKIRLYANGWPRKANTPEGIAEGVKRVVDQGYEALKFYPFGGAQVATIERIQHGVALVEAAREAAGSQIEIGIDIRARLNIWSARRVAQALEPYNIAWMEEPILWDNPAALAQFAHEVNVPIATGEQLYTRWGFRALLELNAVGIIQPDICHAGGITELKKIAAMAETHYVLVAPHNSNGPISTIASLHLNLCIHNSLMQEIFVSSIGLYNKVLTRPIEVLDGHCVPPEGPGWGVELREDVIEQHPPKLFTPIESEPYVEF